MRCRYQEPMAKAPINTLVAVLYIAILLLWGTLVFVIGIYTSEESLLCVAASCSVVVVCCNISAGGCELCIWNSLRAGFQSQYNVNTNTNEKTNANANADANANANVNALLLLSFVCHFCVLSPSNNYFPLIAV